MMTRRLVILAVVAALISGGWMGVAFAADTYKLDKTHMKVGFKVRHLVISNVRGEFTDYDATILLDEKDITKSSMQGTIKTASINTNNEKRDMYKDLDEMTAQTRLAHARFRPSTNAYGPTPAQRESLRIARRLYDEVAGELTTLVDEEYAGLKRALDDAKVPWTPGRGVQQ